MVKPDSYQKQSINRRMRPNILVAVLLIGPLIFLFLSSPQNEGASLQQNISATVIATATQETTENAYPPEIIENPEQTNGIVMAGILLVLIILGGTVSFIRRKN